MAPKLLNCQICFSRMTIEYDEEALVVLNEEQVPEVLRHFMRK